MLFRPGHVSACEIVHVVALGHAEPIFRLRHLDVRVDEAGARGLELDEFRRNLALLERRQRQIALAKFEQRRGLIGGRQRDLQRHKHDCA